MREQDGMQAWSLLVLIGALNHPAGFCRDGNIAQGNISCAVQTVTRDQNKGRFFSVLCPSLPRESSVKRWGMTRREGGSCPVWWVPKGASLLPTSCWGMDVGSSEACSPLPSSQSPPTRCSPDLGPVSPQGRSGPLLGDAKQGHVYLGIPTPKGVAITSH